MFRWVRRHTCKHSNQWNIFNINPDLCNYKQRVSKTKKKPTQFKCQFIRRVTKQSFRFHSHFLDPWGDREGAGGCPATYGQGQGAPLCWKLILRHIYVCSSRLHGHRIGGCPGTAPSQVLPTLGFELWPSASWPGLLPLSQALELYM